MLYLTFPWLFYFITASLYFLIPFTHSLPQQPHSSLATTNLFSVSVSLGFVLLCSFCFLDCTCKWDRERQTQHDFTLCSKRFLSHFHHFAIPVGDDKTLKRMGHFRQTHIYTDIFWIDWLQGDSIYFLFSFLILEKTKNTGMEIYAKSFSNSIYFWLPESLAVKEGAEMLMMPSLKWTCAWAKVTALRSPLLQQSPT